MVLAYHCIFSAYGFWLPNDPRGSWSDWVRSWELLRYGGATKTIERRSLAHDPHDYRQRLAAKAALRYPPVLLDGIQARAVGRGLAEACASAGYLQHACAILPDHVHLVVARHRERTSEEIVRHLKSFATRRLNREGIHPLREHRDRNGNVPSPWSRGTGWIVYLNNVQEILRAIKYVEDNPLKEGKPRQRWLFVTPFIV